MLVVAVASTSKIFMQKTYGDEVILNFHGDNQFEVSKVVPYTTKCMACYHTLLVVLAS